MTKSVTYEPIETTADEAAFWELPCAQAHEGGVAEGSETKVYDLAERTATFGEAVIRFAKKLAWSPVNNRLVDQLVGAATSVGANYAEADDGISRADFKHRISICRKEARETMFFLRMVASSEPTLKLEARELWKEANELHLIFSRIWRSTKT